MIFNLLQYDGHMLDWWYGMYGPFAWWLMAIGWLVYIAITITIAYYVHKDAIRRKIPNPELWLILCLILSVIGYIIYVLARSNYLEAAKVESKERK